jgi:hypothetical protein
MILMMIVEMIEMMIVMMMNIVMLMVMYVIMMMLMYVYAYEHILNIIIIIIHHTPYKHSLLILYWKLFVTNWH